MRALHPLPHVCRLDLPWWDKLLGMTFKGGKVQLKQLTGGKMDDITVLVSYVDVVDTPQPQQEAAQAAQQQQMRQAAAAAIVGTVIPGDGAADSDAPTGSVDGGPVPAATAAPAE